MNKNSLAKKTKVMKKKDFKWFVSNFLNFFKSHKIIAYLGGAVIILIILIIIIVKIVNYNNLNNDIIKINNTKFTKSDYMIYLYSNKYNYFNEKDVDKISEDSLNVIVDDEKKITVRDKLKENALKELKSAAVIKEYAKTNNIKLSKKDYNKLADEKKKYIKSLGGKKKFKQFLKKNNVLDKSYDKMCETDYLYHKILKELYSENELYDLSAEEINQANDSYKDNYYKIEQVVLLTINPTTKNNLLDTEINGKKVIASSVKQMAESGENFEDLIKKYSEDATNKQPPYIVYYKKGELLEELENELVNMNAGDISEVIQTKYAIHIIHKLEMDDSKFSEYLDNLREEKLLKELNNLLDQAKVVYYDAYKKIKN